MLDSYIKIDDIKKLLDETASINGLIKKSDFQKAISLLKEYYFLKNIEPYNEGWGIGLIKLGK